LDQYRQHERTVIIALEGDFDMPTPCTILQEMLSKMTDDQAAYTYAYFLLELALVTDSLAALDFKELCLAAVHIMTRLGDFLKRRKSGGSIGEDVINSCAKEVIMARYLAIERESAIYKKYTQECFGRVAEKTIFIDSPST
jgi:hypothetical protein